MKILLIYKFLQLKYTAVNDCEARFGRAAKTREII
jgi:hypothetical protein